MLTKCSKDAIYAVQVYQEYSKVDRESLSKRAIDWKLAFKMDLLQRADDAEKGDCRTSSGKRRLLNKQMAMTVCRGSTENIEKDPKKQHLQSDQENWSRRFIKKTDRDDGREEVTTRYSWRYTSVIKSARLQLSNTWSCSWRMTPVATVAYISSDIRSPEDGVGHLSPTDKMDNNSVDDESPVCSAVRLDCLALQSSSKIGSSCRSSCRSSSWW